MHEDRYRGGGTDRRGEKRRESTHETPHPTEMRYATHGRRQQEARQSGGSGEQERSHTLSPLLDIARYDERHHYGRHSIERRREESDRRREQRDEQTSRRMHREQRGRASADHRRGPQSRS